MPAAAAAGLDLTDVSVGYRGTQRWPRRRPPRVILARVNAAARTGELTALLGTNGAGKSTLLRSITGLQPLLNGRVELVGDDATGRDLGELDVRERARRVAVTLTERVDAGLLTGRDVTELGRHPHQGLASKLSGPEQHLIDETLAMLQADGFADQRFAELSDGQRQRIVIARALVTEPELLVLDEPSAFLDVGARIELMGLLRSIAQTRMITVLVSTHEVELALQLADQLWLIHDHAVVTGDVPGLIAAGSIAEVFATLHTGFDPHTRTFRLRDA
jgi:iron complex transport system ATP-binding protein